MQQINLLTIGDKSTGSTEFMHSAHHDHRLYHPHHVIKKAFQDKIAEVMITDKTYVKVEVWDASGDTEYRKLLLLPHFQVDVCAIFLSVINQQSFQNALFKWFDDIKDFGKNIEILFVGTGIEEREKMLMEMKQQLKNINQGPICRQVAAELIENSLKCKYIECNPRTNQGVREIYSTAINLVMQRKVVKVYELQQQPRCDCQII